jgi:hypothetical protein
MWKNTVQPDRPQMAIWRMRIAGWIHQATDWHTEYAILTVFPLQQWLHERYVIRTLCVLLSSPVCSRNVVSLSVYDL